METPVLTPLCELAIKHGTDKYWKHGYTRVYYDLFKGRIAATRCVLEIGIKRGASLRMWEEFFPNARIFGVDIKRRNLFNKGRIISYWADQGKPDTLRAVARKTGGPLNVVIDDGTHKAVYQATAMQALLPCMATNGIYVIEDVKHGPDDDIAAITSKIPNGFSYEMILTNDLIDSGLMVIRRC